MLRHPALNMTSLLEAIPQLEVPRQYPRAITVITMVIVHLLRHRMQQEVTTSTTYRTTQNPGDSDRDRAS